ncbi:helix-turn-helix domain-containing protein [Synoicihabitans lomoniglobus]|uniref:helix-turn-helix domain-containing protein n=1 Tax=Synoicihabitans lomoniglobus TaxID=2909285 RepID=UPI002ED57D3D
MKRIEKAIAISSLESATNGLHPTPRPIHGWLRAIREAVGLSRLAIARGLSVSVPTVQDYEKSEKADTITLATLRRYAGALDCELVVALVPRHRKTFLELAAQHDPEIAHLRATEHSMSLEDQGSNDLDQQIKERLS